MKKYCIRHGVVDPTHRCTRDGFVGTDNELRYHKAKRNHTTSAHWRKVRLQRLELDGYQCQLRHRHCTDRANTVHLDPALKGNHLLATLGNTRSACRRCHGKEDAPRSSKGGGGEDRDARSTPCSFPREKLEARLGPQASPPMERCRIRASFTRIGLGDQTCAPHCAGLVKREVRGRAGRVPRPCHRGRQPDPQRESGTLIERLLTARELGELLGLSSSTVLDWFEAGRLPGFKLGRVVRFRESEIADWLEGRRVGPGARGEVVTHT